MYFDNRRASSPLEHPYRDGVSSTGGGDGLEVFSRGQEFGAKPLPFRMPPCLWLAGGFACPGHLGRGQKSLEPPGKMPSWRNTPSHPTLFPARTSGTLPVPKQAAGMSPSRPGPSLVESLWQEQPNQRPSQCSRRIASFGEFPATGKSPRGYLHVRQRWHQKGCVGDLKNIPSDPTSLEMLPIFTR